MISKLGKRMQVKGEGGFTLIELLVVIIIIAILAAIAIPMYLSQRQKGWNANMQSDLRNAAVAEESYFTDNAAYTNVIANLELQGFNPSANVTLAVASADAAGYCINATYTGYATRYHLNSTDGDPRTGTC
ncbi:MAG: type IV pilin protein [Thermoleophilia bacterium]